MCTKRELEKKNKLPNEKTENAKLKKKKKLVPSSRKLTIFLNNQLKREWHRSKYFILFSFIVNLDFFLNVLYLRREQEICIRLYDNVANIIDKHFFFFGVNE